jgi:bacterioferritin-associated ferredoxin
VSASPLAELPAWDRLVAPPVGTLEVAPVQRMELDELLVVDDDLPQCSGATLFWAWADERGWAARAVLIAGSSARPYAIHASRLRLDRPDPNLLRLLEIDAAAPPASVTIHGHGRHLERPPRHLACICRLTPSGEVYTAIEAGWHSVDELKRATGVAFGQCQGRRCVAGLAARLDLLPDEPRAGITPRPPLVPVPASVLAAFVEP